jgi:hypothetical protein
MAEPFDPVVFDRTETVDGLALVASSQTAYDLLTGSGGVPSQGEVLLGWMTSNERSWRR